MTRHFHFALLLLLSMPVLAAEPTDVRDYGSGDMRTLHEGDDNEFTLRDMSLSGLPGSSDPIFSLLLQAIKPIVRLYANPAGLIDDEPNDRLLVRWAPFKIDAKSGKFSTQFHHVSGTMRLSDSTAVQLNGALSGTNLSPKHPSMRTAGLTGSWAPSQTTRLGLLGQVRKDDEDSEEGYILNAGAGIIPVAQLELGVNAFVERSESQSDEYDSLDFNLTAVSFWLDERLKVGTNLYTYSDETKYKDGNNENYQSDWVTARLRLLYEHPVAEGSDVLAGMTLDWHSGSEKEEDATDSTMSDLTLGAGYRDEALFLGAEFSLAQSETSGDIVLTEEDDHRSWRLGLSYRLQVKDGEVALIPSAGFGQTTTEVKLKDGDIPYADGTQKSRQISLGLGLDWADLAFDLTVARHRFDDPEDLDIDLLMLAGVMEF